MGDLAVSLPSYFGISGAHAIKDRGAFLLETSAGFFKISKSGASPREISARYDLLKKLSAAGFSRTDEIIPAATGVPFVNLGRDTFVMTRHFPGREPDMGNFDDVALLLENVARFHIAARNFEKIEIPAAPSLLEIFSKQISALNSAVKQVNRNSRLSDFDVLVLKHADFFAALAENAKEKLAATDYTVLHAAALSERHICHNALKEEAFSVADGGCFISRFDEAAFDLQLVDVAAILRRFARKSSREVEILRLVEVYDKIAPLSASAVEILYAQLAFPWAFLKIVSHFYSKKRNFIPAAITTRMNEVLAEQEAYNCYIIALNSTQPIKKATTPKIARCSG